MKNFFLWLWNGEDVAHKIGLGLISVGNLVFAMHQAAVDGFQFPTTPGGWAVLSLQVLVAFLTAAAMRPKKKPTTGLPE